ncbi:hypothetical protein Sp245p_31390 (plasmid) [Azospirillum baldaniorum]|uniref:Uncharacterized protein n=2 Tax=Azospirillum baldaniorum TaxID=1064539 RepID=A0A9P1K1N7_9PROT|nr:hypothetical protein Sp245p_31390 [Azospirillum baldaniorum]CCD03889.1 membrane protein of unknown function [Azospirillum baldaniorum]
MAALVILITVALPSAAFAVTADPFQPTVAAGNAVTNFAIWGVRMLGFIGLVVAAVKAYFKKFDFIFLASVVAGILLVASAPLIINYAFSLGGLSDASSVGSYTPIK